MSFPAVGIGPVRTRPLKRTESPFSTVERSTWIVLAAGTRMRTTVSAAPILLEPWYRNRMPRLLVALQAVAEPPVQAGLNGAQQPVPGIGIKHIDRRRVEGLAVFVGQTSIHTHPGSKARTYTRVENDYSLADGSSPAIAVDDSALDLDSARSGSELRRGSDREPQRSRPGVLRSDRGFVSCAVGGVRAKFVHAISKAFIVDVGDEPGRGELGVDAVPGRCAHPANLDLA